MTERTVVRVEHHTIRAGEIGGPIQWARGDFTKVFSDGTKEPATFDECRAFMGLPPMKNIEVERHYDDQ